jgi:hypothetical protein
MRNGFLALAMLTGVALFGVHPAAAYYEGPWCAIVDIGPGSSTSKCDFRDFESCRMEIIGGNGGFCNHNPRWTGRDPSRALERASKPRRSRN